jgi:hypothetical protein
MWGRMSTRATDAVRGEAKPVSQMVVILNRIAGQSRAQTEVVGIASTQAGRDLRIDFLRGFAVFIMIVDHVGGPSILWLLISGIVAGIVYRRVAVRQGLSRAVRRLLVRAGKLYALVVGLTLLELPLSELLHLWPAHGVPLGNPPLLLWRIVSLQQSYEYVDIPLLYTMLLAVAPLALWAMYRGQTGAVLVVSWLLWAAYQLFPQQTEWPWPVADSNFHFLGWQVVFFTGLALGYHRDRLERAFPASRRKLLLLSTAAGSLGLVVLFISTRPADWWGLGGTPLRLLLDHQVLPSNVLDWLFAKSYARPGRLLASAILFPFVFQVTSALWDRLRAWLGWFLLPLGQNALCAYSAHVVLFVGLALVAAWMGPRYPDSATANAVVQLGCVALIWLAIRCSVRAPHAPRRPT